MQYNEITRTPPEVTGKLNAWQRTLEKRETKGTLVVERNHKQAKLHEFGAMVLSAFPEKADDPRASRAIVLNQATYGGVVVNRVVRIVRRVAAASDFADAPRFPTLAVDLFDALAVPSVQFDRELVLPDGAEIVGAGTSTVNPKQPHDVFVGIHRPESEIWLGTLDSAKSPIHRDQISREALNEYFDTRAQTATMIVEALRSGELNPKPAGFSIPPILQQPPIEV